MRRLLASRPPGPLVGEPPPGAGAQGRCCAALLSCIVASRKFLPLSHCRLCLLCAEGAQEYSKRVSFCVCTANQGEGRGGGVLLVQRETLRPWGVAGKAVMAQAGGRAGVGVPAPGCAPSWICL